MKYINKSPEPKELTNWKKSQKQIGVNCNYRSLSKPEKPLVHESLLKEQGYICCYCCKKITPENSHIEHLNPQSKNDDDLSVDYGNLLASCGPYDKEDQQEKKKKFPEHCGNYKGNLAICISPLQIDCEDYFLYTGSGEIISTTKNHAKAKDTIDKLNLNYYDLKETRRNIIEAILHNMTPQEAQKLIKYYQNLDQNGCYQPFCVALLYFLKQYY